MKRLLLLITLLFSAYALADDFRPASLTIEQLTDNKLHVTWKVPIKNGQLATLNVSFDSSSKDKLPKRSRSIDGSYVKIWHIYREQGVSGLTVFIDGLSGSGYEVILRIPAKDTNSTTITKILNTDTVSFTVPQNQSLSHIEIFVSYVSLGFEHILAGLDHLLFVFALLLLVVSRKKLIWTITFFTLAHSMTLAAVTLDWLYFSGPPVEATIALSIVFLAKEIIMVNRGQSSFTAQYPWLVAFMFGLLHGLGFAGALSEIGIPENEVFNALFAFNVGVELGQLAFVMAALSVMSLGKRLVFGLPHWANQLPAYVIGCTACFGFLQRLVML